MIFFLVQREYAHDSRPSRCPNKISSARETRDAKGLAGTNFSHLSNRSTARTNLSPCASLTFRYASAPKLDPHLHAYLDDRNDNGMISISLTVDRISLTCSSEHLFLAGCIGCSQTLGVVGRHAARPEGHATDRGGRYKDLKKGGE